MIYRVVGVMLCGVIALSGTGCSWLNPIDDPGPGVWELKLSNDNGTQEFHAYYLAYRRGELFPGLPQQTFSAINDERFPLWFNLVRGLVHLDASPTGLIVEADEIGNLSLDSFFDRNWAIAGTMAATFLLPGPSQFRAEGPTIRINESIRRSGLAKFQIAPVQAPLRRLLIEDRFYTGNPPIEIPGYKDLRVGEMKRVLLELPDPDPIRSGIQQYFDGDYGPFPEARVLE